MWDLHMLLHISPDRSQNSDRTQKGNHSHQHLMSIINRLNMNSAPPVKCNAPGLLWAASESQTVIPVESKHSVSHWHLVLFADALSQMPFKPHQNPDFPEQRCFYLCPLLSGSASNKPRLCIPPFMQFAPVVSEVHLQISRAFVPNILSSSYHCAPIELSTFQPSSLSFL